MVEWRIEEVLLLIPLKSEYLHFAEMLSLDTRDGLKTLDSIRGGFKIKFTNVSFSGLNPLLTLATLCLSLFLLALSLSLFLVLVARFLVAVVVILVPISPFLGVLVGLV